MAGETVLIVARFTSAVAVDPAAPPPRLMLGLARRDKSDAYADVLNGTRAAQPFDLVESITNYDLPFRATVYDLVFSYTVQPGDNGNLAHSGRGALHVEVSPSIS